MKVLFLHGWNSVPGGVKPTYLKDHGQEVINPSLPDDDFAEAVHIAQAEFDQHRPQVVVGSSRGGAVAMNINSGEARLVLLCRPGENTDRQLFSIFATLTMGQWNPRQWLPWYLESCAAQGGKAPAEITPFLPWNLTDEPRLKLGEVDAPSPRDSS
jgi:hypothetical protein